MLVEAPASHRSPIAKPSRPKPSRPSKPSRPKTHEKHDAPTRSKGGTDKKGTKEKPKKSAGLEERDVVEFDGGGLRFIPSLGALPN